MALSGSVGGWSDEARTMEVLANNLGYVVIAGGFWLSARGLLAAGDSPAAGRLLFGFAFVVLGWFICRL